MYKFTGYQFAVLLTALALSFFSSWAYCDERYPRNVSFQNVLQSEDIALGEVEAIVQDHEGFIWLGGRNALLRFDGTELLNITISSGEGTNKQIKNVNQAIDLFEDSRHQLWVATRSGLYIYNRDREDLTEAHAHQASFAKNVVSSIDELPSGEILLASWNGLYIYNSHTEEYRLFEQAEQPFDEPINKTIYDLVVDRQQNVIWLATAKGLQRLDWNTQKNTHFLPDPDKPESVSNNTLKSIAQDDQGNLWLGADNGLYRFNPVTQQFAHYVHDADDPRSLTDNIVQHVTVGKNGWLWVACQGGLNLFNRANNNFIRYIHEEGQPTSLSSSITRRVYEDRNGDLWVGTYPSGANFYDRSSDAIRVLKPTLDPSRGLLSKTVEAITEDQQGNLWIGASGVTRYNPKEDTFVHYRYTAKNPGIKTLEPISGFTDSTGAIWFGSWLNSFHLYNRQTDRFDQLEFDTQLNGAKLQLTDKLPDNSIWSVYEDRNRNFWLATHNAGLLKFDPSARTYRIFAPVVGNAHSLSNAVVWTSREDSKGRFWVGTAKGLNLMDRQTGSFKRYEADPQLPNQLINDSVLAIFEDRKGRMWFGTDAGLHLYRETTDDFEVFGAPHGFVDSGIRNITEDPLGNLWLGTNNGIVRFNPDTLAVQNYVRHNSEKIGGTSTGASLTTSKDIVAIGSKNGLFLIDTTKIQLNKTPPPIAFTDLRIFTEKATIGGADGILQRVINQTQAIRLDYTKTMLSLHFAALNFRNPDKNRYAYKLEGFDEQWRDVGNQRSALYTNLDAGSYMFRVRAANNDGVWNDEGRSIRIVQLPPPWKSTWAYVFYAVILISFISQLVCWQLNKRRRLEEQSRLLEIKVAERTAQLHEKNISIAAMLSHMRQGLFTLEQDGRIHAEYSRHLEEIFAQRDLAGKNGLELLFAHSSLIGDSFSRLCSAVESMLGEDDANYDCNVHLLINEYEIYINGVHKFLSLDWNPIIEQHIVIKMMVSVRDVTALRQMEHAAQIQKRELDIIGQLIKISAEKYRLFASSCHRFIAQSRAEIQMAKEYDPAVIALLFRNLHTIKGNGRTFGFTHVSEAAHNAETYCSQLTHTSDNAWNQSQLLKDLQLLDDVLNEYQHVFTQVLGRGDAFAENPHGVWFDSRTLKTIATILSAVRIGKIPSVDKHEWQNIEQLINGSLAAPLNQVLADVFNSLPSLAAQLNKAAPNVCCRDEPILINNQGHQLVQNVFAHLLRNCIDHGIELPEVRTALGKSTAGIITVVTDEQEQELVISVRDDGGGLDLLMLYQLGLRHGYWQADAHPTYTQIANIIFEPGISSKDKITDISGRGVGMAAVKQFLFEHGGNITIKLDCEGEIRQIPSIKIPFEFIIKLPSSLFIIRCNEYKGNAI
ncbi:MAG TPA: two-component regulator propeller domain-containing protein [Cellvibrionaceae bacterium]